MKKNKLTNKVIYVSLFLGYFLLLFIWSMNQEYGSGPEENMRYQIPKFIFENNRLPTLFDTSIYDEYWGFSYAGQPCLPYILGALFMKIAQLFGVESAHMYMAARMTSILCGCVFLYLVIKISKELFENIYARIFFVSVITLWKYTCYIFTYVNCDSLCLVGVAIVILYCIKGLKNDWTILNCLGIALGNGIILLSYINGCAYAIVSFVIFVASYIVKEDKPKKYLGMILKGILILVIVTIMSAWFYIRNIVLYGSLFGSNITHSASKKYGSAEIASDILRRSAKESMFSIEGIITWIKGQVISFCGQFTVDDIWISTVISCVVAIFMGTLLVAAIYKLIKSRKSRTTNEKIFSISMLIGIIVTIGLDFYYSAFVTYIAYYARYLMPMIISFGYFTTHGYLQVTENNKKRRNALLVISIMLLVIPDLSATMRGL